MNNHFSHTVHDLLEAAIHGQGSLHGEVLQPDHGEGPAGQHQQGLVPGGGGGELAVDKEEIKATLDVARRNLADGQITPAPVGKN